MSSEHRQQVIKKYEARESKEYNFAKSEVKKITVPRLYDREVDRKEKMKEMVQQLLDSAQESLKKQSQKEKEYLWSELEDNERTMLKIIQATREHRALLESHMTHVTPRIKPSDIAKKYKEVLKEMPETAIREQLPEPTLLVGLKADFATAFHFKKIAKRIRS